MREGDVCNLLFNYDNEGKIFSLNVYMVLIIKYMEEIEFQIYVHMYVRLNPLSVIVKTTRFLTTAALSFMF